MKDFLSASTTVVRRRGETVIASREAIDKHPVILPAPTSAGRFEIREGSSADTGKHFAIVWAPLTVAGEEPLRPLPLIAFREADEAREALVRIEKAFTRPWWRKAVRVYQVLGFVVAILATMAFWNTLSIGHGAPQGPAAAIAQQPADQAPAAPSVNGLDPAALAALISHERAALAAQQAQQPGAVQGSVAPPVAAPAPSTAPAGSPGDAVANALNGKK